MILKKLWQIASAFENEKGTGLFHLKIPGGRPDDGFN